MSTAIAKNFQVGSDGTATNNFTIRQPATPDGTVRIANGNSGTTTDLVTVTSAGNVGVGTSSPAVKLDVVGTTTSALRLRSNSAASNGFNIYNDSSTDIAYLNNFYSGAMVFATNNTERMRLDSSGNLGIGTTSPQKPLHVYSSTGVVGNATMILEGVTGGYGAGVSFRSVLTGGSLAEMARITADGEAPWNTTASTQDAGLRFYTALDGTVAEKLRLDASGNLGVGTSSPWSQISSYGASGATTQYIGFKNADGGDIRFGKASGVDNGCILGTWSGNGILLYTNSTERARIDSSGNLLVGTTSAPANWNTVSPKMRVAAGGIQVGDYCLVCEDAFDTDSLCLVSDSTENICFGNYNRSTLVYTERARITSGGDLLVGTTGTGARLRVDSAGTTSGTQIVQFNNSSAVEAFRVRSDGAVFTGTSTSGLAACPYNNTTANAANMVVGTGGDLQRSTSSLRYKTNVQDATHGLAEVMQLRPVTYKGKNDGDTVFGGLIAEEVHAAGLTEFVTYDEQSRPDALAYGNMVSLCIKAIQELKAELDSVKTELALLKGTA